MASTKARKARRDVHNKGLVAQKQHDARVMRMVAEGPVTIEGDPRQGGQKTVGRMSRQTWICKDPRYVGIRRRRLADEASSTHQQAWTMYRPRFTGATSN